VCLARARLSVGQYCDVVTFQSIVKHGLEFVLEDTFSRNVCLEDPIKVKLFLATFICESAVVDNLPLRTSFLTLVGDFIISERFHPDRYVNVVIECTLLQGHEYDLAGL